MDTQEVVEAVEEAKDVAVAVKSSARLKVVGVVSGIVIFAAGGLVGYQVAKRRLVPKYEAHLAEEIEAAKDFYKRVAKEGEYETPEKAARALNRYRGEEIRVIPEGGTITNTEDIQEEDSSEELMTVVEEKNVFVESKSNAEKFDYDAEMANRESGKPYVITRDEFMQNETEYDQITLTYFAGDDVLTDDQDKPIENTNRVVGDANLMKFGYGSKDNRVVYVRNDKMDSEFEIIKHDGKYSQEILGYIEHSDRKPLRKMRRYDE